MTSWRHRATRTVVIVAALLTAGLTAAPAWGQDEQICAADLNGNGDADDPGEVTACEAIDNPATGTSDWLCPFHRTACVADAMGDYSCPLGAEHACITPAGSSVPLCSQSDCTPPDGPGVVDDPVIDDPGAPADGAVDPKGNCLGNVEIFAGRAVRCRPPGLRTTFANCCKDHGKIVKDGMGGSIGSIRTKIAIAKGVFTGMKAAYLAFKAGATAGEAASAGANAIILGIDPASIAISLAINFMFDFLLSGCDQQDMEVGMLRGSGMCHEVGTYCSSKILGICIQKSKGHCCFNTKLGRIIQEQGRPQLRSFNGIGWGTPKEPTCRGFTPEEFQALDFSKMDLSEYYSELEARSQAEIQIDMKGKIDGYMQSVGQ